MSWNGLLLLNDTIPPLYLLPPLLPPVGMNIFLVITLSLSLSLLHKCVVVL
jgi:hypothetical protein